MGKSLEIVNQFHHSVGNKSPEWQDLVTDDVLFSGPVQTCKGKKEFIQLNNGFFQFHKKTRMLNQFENGNTVCSIYEMDIKAPSGKDIVCHISELATLKGGQITEFKIYYDPREFMKEFSMEH